MARRKKTTKSWLHALSSHVLSRPCVVIRLSGIESEQLEHSRRGFAEFTIALPHELLSHAKPPTICLIFDVGPQSPALGRGRGPAHVGLLSSKEAVTTLETRIKIKYGRRITPSTQEDLLRLLDEPREQALLRTRLDSSDSVVTLSPNLSVSLMHSLASIEVNEQALKTVAEAVQVSKRFSGPEALQGDAVHLALKAFGLNVSEPATRVTLAPGKATTLARVAVEEAVPLIEDSVIEHDARTMPGFTLKASHITGRATFSRGSEMLEVITANRRGLEHVFGVDLIYFNETKQSIVMVQYKMLEPVRKASRIVDWSYRPDKDLDDQIRKMKTFARSHAPAEREYRLNPQVFYLKFVKRDGAIANGSIVTPLDHFEKIRKDPSSKGARGQLRISYEALNGQYLRETAFVDLIRSGYIGAFAKTTRQLRTLIESVLSGNRALVAAIQRQVKP